MVTPNESTKSAEETPVSTSTQIWFKWATIWKNDMYRDLSSMLIYTGIMALLFFLIQGMYDPDAFAGLNDLVANYPEAVQKIFGSIYTLSIFEGYLNVEILAFSFLWYGIYCMMRTGQDIPRDIETKTIDLILSKPITRSQYVIGKFLKHVVFAIMVNIASYLAIALGIFVYPAFDSMRIFFGRIALVFVWNIMLLICLDAVALIFSTLVDARKSVALGLSSLVVFYFIGTYWEDFPEILQWIKYVSPLYYFDTADLLINGNLAILPQNLLVLGGITIGCFTLALLIFHRKDILI